MLNRQLGFPKMWSEDRTNTADKNAERVAFWMLGGLAIGIVLVIVGTSFEGPSYIWKGSLSALACSVVGCFLGFLFGIPRHLSSDTARTTLPTPDNNPPNAAKTQAATAPDLQAATDKAAASQTAARTAADRKDQADADVNGKTEAATTAATAAAAAKYASEQDPNNPDLTKAADDAKVASDTAADGLKLAKSVADTAAQALQIATNQATTDQAAADKLTQQQSRNQAQSGSGTASTTAMTKLHGSSTTVNTNLEQISDWLTKIIVGVTLVQADTVLQKLHRIAEVIAGCVGALPKLEETLPFAYAILIYFSVLGFFGSYLLTRLWLQSAFDAADSGGKQT